MQKNNAIEYLLFVSSSNRVFSPIGIVENGQTGKTLVKKRVVVGLFPAYPTTYLAGLASTGNQSGFCPYRGG